MEFESILDKDDDSKRFLIGANSKSDWLWIIITILMCVTFANTTIVPIVSIFFHRSKSDTFDADDLYHTFPMMLVTFISYCIRRISLVSIKLILFNNNYLICVEIIVPAYLGIKTHYLDTLSKLSMLYCPLKSIVL